MGKVSVQGSEFRVQRLGFSVESSGLRGLGFRIEGLGLYLTGP